MVIDDARRVVWCEKKNALTYFCLTGCFKFKTKIRKTGGKKKKKVLVSAPSKPLMPSAEETWKMKFPAIYCIVLDTDVF